MGGGAFLVTQNSNCQVLTNFSFLPGGGDILGQPRIGIIGEMNHKFRCIADSLSHTTCVETTLEQHWTVELALAKSFHCDEIGWSGVTLLFLHTLEHNVLP